MARLQRYFDMLGADVEPPTKKSRNHTSASEDDHKIQFQEEVTKARELFESAKVSIL